MTRSPRVSLRAAMITTGFLLAYGFVCLMILGTHLAFGHDATPTAAVPQGWAYPFSCCSGYDCREVADASIVEGARGYEIRATGELIPMLDTRIRNSPDGKFHWCSVAGANDGRTICLFVPSRSF